MESSRNKKFLTTRRFDKSFVKLPEDIQEATYEKLELFHKDPKHPSLRVKRMRGTNAIWEMSVTMNYRITFAEADTAIILRKIGTHDILSNP